MQSTSPADPGIARIRLPLWPIRVAVVFFLIVCVGFHLGMAKRGYSNYRDQHLGAALEYAKGKIDLLHPTVVGFNAGNTSTPLEFPIWQATAAILFKAFGTWFGWANITSLLFGITALWPVFQLTRVYTGERAAWWTLLLYISQPLIFCYNGYGGTDGSCLTFTVWFLYFTDLLLRTRQVRWLLPSAIFGVLSAVTKAPFFFCAGLASFFLLLLHGRHDLRRWGLLIAVGAVSAGVFALWTKHINAMAAQAEFPLVDLRLSAGEDGGKFMRYWFFGDWSYRLSLANWIKGGWRFLAAETGSYALAGLLVWGLFWSRNRLAQFLVLAGLVTTLVFTHLVLHHTHYYLMFSPAVAALCGWATERLEAALTERATSRVASVTFSGIFSFILFLSLVQGLIGMKIALATDSYPHRIAETVRQHTSKEDKLLIQGGGWGGEMLILADRRGLSIWDTKFLEKPEHLARIRELGFNKLVMISESPMLVALQQSNPGQADQQRNLYQKHLTPVVEPWNVVFRTDDLLIKEIPAANEGK